MRLKIISDGQGWNTRLVNAETGETIDGCSELTWHITHGGEATVVAKFVDVPAELVGLVTPVEAAAPAIPPRPAERVLRIKVEGFEEARQLLAAIKRQHDGLMDALA